MKIYCPCCNALAINGVPSHERGCPHSDKQWVCRGRGENRVCIPENEEVPEYLRPQKRKRIWLGVTTVLDSLPNKREIFKCVGSPTRESHGKIYTLVIGPFRTMRGARFMRDFGVNNPHCQTTYDAERLALLHKSQHEACNRYSEHLAKEINKKRRISKHL